MAFSRTAVSGETNRFASGSAAVTVTGKASIPAKKSETYRIKDSIA